MSEEKSKKEFKAVTAQIDDYIRGGHTQEDTIKLVDELYNNCAHLTGELNQYCRRIQKLAISDMYKLNRGSE